MKLIWLDLETTGLEPSKCDILEVAVAVADFNDPFNYRHVLNRVMYCSTSTQKSLDPFIIDMHTKNGLLADCARSYHNVGSAEEELLQIVPEVANKDERPIIAGSTISFDHNFLRVHMPRVAARLSHRNYDVSAIKLFCQSLGMPKFPKAEAHRAKADIEESIAHGKACVEWLKKNLGVRFSPDVHTR